LEGDHVKVINGKHKDETGLVLKIVGSIITVLSDLTLKEIVVFSKDLRAATEITSTVSTIGPYDIHDLVQIGYFIYIYIFFYILYVYKYMMIYCKYKLLI